MFVKMDREAFRVSAESKIGGLSSCMSLLYAKVRDFIMVNRVIMFP